MRIGMNPEKQVKKIKLKYNHRVVIVVYIPSLEGYYKGVFEVFKLCLASVHTTINEHCAITIVNNASCNEVVNYINEQFEEGIIDSVVHHKMNIGKMDALIGAARGVREPLITLSDVDILYKTGWQEAAETIFYGMEQVGSVSPIPFRKTVNYGTSSTMKQIILGRVSYKPEAIPENFESYNSFRRSINWEEETDRDALWPVVEKNGIKAILGSNHQVMTLNRDVILKGIPVEPSLILVGNGSEYNYCDKPIDKSGGMRLATYNNYAYHMGNTVEPWMVDLQSKNEIQKSVSKITVANKKLDFKFNTNSDRKYMQLKRLYEKLFEVFINRKRV